MTIDVARVKFGLRAVKDCFGSLLPAKVDQQNKICAAQNGHGLVWLHLRRESLAEID